MVADYILKCIVEYNAEGLICIRNEIFSGSYYLYLYHLEFFIAMHLKILILT